METPQLKLHVIVNKTSLLEVPSFLIISTGWTHLRVIEWLFFAKINSEKGNMPFKYNGKHQKFFKCCFHYYSRNPYRWLRSGWLCLYEQIPPSQRMFSYFFVHGFWYDFVYIENFADLGISFFGHETARMITLALKMA